MIALLTALSIARAMPQEASNPHKEVNHQQIIQSGHQEIFMNSLPATIITPKTLSTLIEMAMAGQKNSYAPYSQYFVGAAILTKSGKIYSGCNIENASYGLGNCAERTAVFKAVSEGEKSLRRL